MKKLFVFAVLFFSTQMWASDMYWIDPTEDFNEIAPATPSSPPREFFSMNTLYLGEKIIVHVGHDLINQTYVVLPSPNITKVEELSGNQRRVTIQQYFPELQEKILNNFKIEATKLHFMYLQSYEVFDQDGNLVNKLTIPQGIQYRPPQYYSFDVPSKVTTLSFVFGFVGRTAWSDSGISADLHGLYKDLRDIGVDRESALKIDLNPASGARALEVLTSNENQKLTQLISDFQHIVAWGRMSQKDDLINKIVDLKNFEAIHIDLAKGVEDLRKYPHIFGDPLNPKFQTVIRKMSSEKLTEKEHSSEKAASAKLGIGSMFSGEGSGSHKKSSRMKEMVKFEIEGEMYVPKSLDFVIRTNDSFDLLKTLVFQAYDHLEESYFRLGTGVAINPYVEPARSVVVTGNTLSNPTPMQQNTEFLCPNNSILAGIKSTLAGFLGRSYQYECRQLSYSEIPIIKSSCANTPVVNELGKPFTFECSGDQFLNGERTSIVPATLDRTFSYQCCNLGTESKKLKKKSCSWSGWVNNPLHPTSFSCPANQILNGVQSEFVPLRHHLGRLGFFMRIAGDRKYNYECCTYDM